MEKIKFDFNNMLSSSVGDKHGVSESDLSEASGLASRAQQHLSALINNPATRIKVGLEWVRLPFQAKSEIRQIQESGNEIAKKYENVIFLGIGGSYLGLKAAQEALCLPYYNEFSALRKGRPKVYFEGNNFDPDTLHALLKNLNPKKTFAVVISKSGETTETKAAFTVIEAWLKKTIGAKFGRQIIAITDSESGSLRKRVEAEHKQDKLSFRSLPLLKGVGGRFSGFNMGLLHLAITGMSIQDVLDGAAQMYQQCLEPDILKNPACMYALLHTVLYRKKGKDIAVMMPFAETLKSTADWYVQLLAESLGKKYNRKGEVVNVGRTPVAARGTNDLHSIQQNNSEGENNKVITFIRVEKFKSEVKIQAKGDFLSGKFFSELIKLAQEATEWALVQEERPNCTIVMPEVSPFYWGALLFFFEMATAFEGELLDVNAFDQQGVEGYKNYMYYKLGKSGLAPEICEKIKNNPLVKDNRFII